MVATCTPGHRTAVNQQPFGGTDYPFAALQRIGCTVTDFYLSYDDIDCRFERPFFLHWVHGIGIEPTSLSVSAGTPTPTHTVDLVITDVNGEVVFDSTTADRFRITTWGDRRIGQWETDGSHAVARLVWRDSQKTAFFTDEFPGAALDHRTLNRLAKRVRSVRVGLQKFTDVLGFSEGYNVGLTLPAPAIPPVDGGRFFTQIGISASPGDGLGVAPGCEDTQAVIRRINKQSPLSGGNFILELDGCYRMQFPVVIGADMSGNRTATLSGFSLTQEQLHSALLMINDCTPCCKCSYYVRTYEGLKRQWFNWLDTAHTLEHVRDVYRDNRDRWLAQLQCRLDHPLRAVVMSEPNFRSMVGAIYCNMRTCCVTDVELRFTVQRYINGVETFVPPPNSNTYDGTRSGSFSYGDQDYILGGSWPVYRGFLPFLDPQDSGSIKARICYAGGTNESLKVTVTSHILPAGVLPDKQTGLVCPLPTQTVPPDIQAIWNAAGLFDVNTVVAIVDKSVPVNPNQAEFVCAC